MTATAPIGTVRTIQPGTEIPQSYEQALADGWRVVSERTPLVHGEGRLLMCKDGVPESVAISYQATATGYTYSTPQAVTEDVAAQAEHTWESHFREFGCLSCETKDAPHAGYGLCRNCIERVSNRLEKVIAQQAA